MFIVSVGSVSNGELVTFVCLFVVLAETDDTHSQ
jgi:hypothetical protein